jgi:hypothetical protein
MLQEPRPASPTAIFFFVFFFILLLCYTILHVPQSYLPLHTHMLCTFVHVILNKNKSSRRSLFSYHYYAISSTHLQVISLRENRNKIKQQHEGPQLSVKVSYYIIYSCSVASVDVGNVNFRYLFQEQDVSTIHIHVCHLRNCSSIWTLVYICTINFQLKRAQLLLYIGLSMSRSSHTVLNRKKY